MSSKNGVAGSNGVAEAPETEPWQARATGYGRPLFFLAIFLPYLALLTRYCAQLHYTLPTPVVELYDEATGRPQFSEAQALAYIKHYADDIGYRIVGTREMDETVQYTLKVLEDIKSQIADPAHVQIEVAHQVGNGHHLFDFMGKKVWKKYMGISNIVVRLSNGTDASKENAILVNAHLDSTLPSPGAADDAAGIAVMLEMLRVMSQTPGLALDNAIVFLFNGAEETLQDASHLFITQHEWRDTIRAAVNLEACGTAGAAMLFQATSPEMIRAYAQAPRPVGTITATEIFATGLILSDTDFRQFEQYGGLTGLDIALVKDSYKYHTRLDRFEYIETGAMQHLGENTLAILSYLAGNVSAAELRGIRKAKEIVYFTSMGGKIMVLISAKKASAIYFLLFAATVLFAAIRVRRDRIAGYVVAFISVPATLVSCIITADLTAAVMVYVLDKPLTYFRREWWCVVLYGAPTLLGMAVCQYLTAVFIEQRGYFKPGEGLMQHAVLLGTLSFCAVTALAGHASGVLASYSLGIPAASLLLTLMINDYVLVRGTESPSRRGVSNLAYLIGQTAPLLLGLEGSFCFMDVFVPLTGRMGIDAPSDIIIASLVSAILFLLLTTLPALCHRWGSAFLGRTIIFLLFLTGLVMSIFAAPSWRPFDAEHPERIGCLYMENTTSGDLTLHLAGMSSASTIRRGILERTAEKLSLPHAPVPTKLDDDIPDWDIIYPISQFFESYKIPLPALDPSYVSSFKEQFKIQVVESRLNAVKQTRQLTIEVVHPGIIWTVIAFSADVISWDLPEPPERGLIRHHIKEASGYGISTYRLSMTVQLTPVQFDAALRQSQRKKGQRPKGGPEEAADEALAGIRIDYSGLDVDRMWHAEDNEDRAGMEFVTRLDRALPDWTDNMLLTAVAGVAIV